MPCRMGILACLLCALLMIAKAQAAAAPPKAIVCDNGYTPLEKLAAKEVRRYIYLRTGTLLPIVLPDKDTMLPTGSLIVISTKDHTKPAASLPDDEIAKLQAEAARLGPQQYLLKTWKHGDDTWLWVVGGDPLSALYGAYRRAGTLDLDRPRRRDRCRRPREGQLSLAALYDGQQQRFVGESAEAVKDDFEYYIEVGVGGRMIQFPPAGPAMPQTVVVE